MNEMLYTVGIDEVGRGPVAGPVAVGGVIFFRDPKDSFAGVRDSKKTSPQKRRAWLEILDREKGSGNLDYAVSFVSASSIDLYGIAVCIEKAVARTLAKLSCNPEDVRILLDGGLRAPKKYFYQKTIIRGDETEQAIALASIAAKVERDARMERYALKYPGYGFEFHKGYGTLDHRRMIRRYGPSDIHRRTFLRKIYANQKKTKK
ncbi:ribonuclease HII [bacterium]|nr:ribonuclease HII [bacterium]MCI0565791.1 ribonuclease HII [bacterium]MCI0680316.1 ribonuclease HII [bacterium]